MNAGVNRRENYRDAFDAGFCSENEEVFGSWIAHGQTANGNSVPMYHDIAAELGSAIAASTLFIERIGIIDAKG